MDDPTTSAPPGSAGGGGGGVREEMIANGVAFLLHPRVQAAPLSQRITFLERKVRVIVRFMGGVLWSCPSNPWPCTYSFKVDRRMTTASPPATHHLPNNRA